MKAKDRRRLNQENNEKVIDTVAEESREKRESEKREEIKRRKIRHDKQFSQSI